MSRPCPFLSRDDDTNTEFKGWEETPIKGEGPRLAPVPIVRVKPTDYPM